MSGKFISETPFPMKETPPTDIEGNNQHQKTSNVPEIKPRKKRAPFPIQEHDLDGLQPFQVEGDDEILQNKNDSYQSVDESSFVHSSMSYNSLVRKKKRVPTKLPNVNPNSNGKDNTVSISSSNSNRGIGRRKPLPDSTNLISSDGNTVKSMNPGHNVRKRMHPDVKNNNNDSMVAYQTEQIELPMTLGLQSNNNQGISRRKPSPEIVPTIPASLSDSIYLPVQRVRTRVPTSHSEENINRNPFAHQSMANSEGISPNSTRRKRNPNSEPTRSGYTLDHMSLPVTESSKRHRRRPPNDSQGDIKSSIGWMGDAADVEDGTSPQSKLHRKRIYPHHGEKNEYSGVNGFSSQNSIGDTLIDLSHSSKWEIKRKRSKWPASFDAHMSHTSDEPGEYISRRTIPLLPEKQSQDLLLIDVSRSSPQFKRKRSRTSNEQKSV